MPKRSRSPVSLRRPRHRNLQLQRLRRLRLLKHRQREQNRLQHPQEPDEETTPPSQTP